MMSRLMTPREQLVIGFFGLTVLAGSITAVWINRAPDPADAVPVSEAPAAEIADEPAPVAERTVAAAPADPVEVVVAIQGAVERPGVYTMRAGQRVNDLLIRAGGATDSADLDDINLAAKLLDGSTLVVPELAGGPTIENGVVTLRRTPNREVPNPPEYTLSRWSDAGSPEVTTAADDSPVARGGTPPVQDDSRIDLNRATAVELESLPGVGPVLAQSIVDYRSNTPFRSIEDLQNVRGIGPKRFESLRDLVTVHP